MTEEWTPEPGERECKVDVYVPREAMHTFYYPFHEEVSGPFVLTFNPGEDYLNVLEDVACMVERDRDADGVPVAWQWHECKYHCSRIIWDVEVGYPGFDFYPWRAE